jgi:hypothetical protein
VAAVVTAVVAAAAVTAAALAAAVPVAAATAAALAVVVPAAVVTAVAVAATKLLPELGVRPPVNQGPSGPFFMGRSPVGLQTSVARRLRGRPDSTLSYSAFGKSRSNLATQPICQGMTR